MMRCALLLLLAGCTATPKVEQRAAMLSPTEPACRRTTSYTAEEWALVSTWPEGLRWARPGDVNCDGAIDFDDINPFVEALVGPVTRCWAKRLECRYLNADCNGDCVVDFDDINPFVRLLTQGE